MNHKAPVGTHVWRRAERWGCNMILAMFGFDCLIWCVGLETNEQQAHMPRMWCWWFVGNTVMMIRFSMPGCELEPACFSVQAARGTFVNRLIYHHLPLCTGVLSNREAIIDVKSCLHNCTCWTNTRPAKLLQPHRAFCSHLRALEMIHLDPLLQLEVKNFAQGHLSDSYWKEKIAFKLPASCPFSLGLSLATGYSFS